MLANQASSTPPTTAASSDQVMQDGTGRLWTSLGQSPGLQMAWRRLPVFRSERRSAPNQSQKTLLGSSEQSLSCSVCARCNHRHRNKQIRVLQYLTRLETFSIKLRCRVQSVRCKMCCERKG